MSGGQQLRVFKCAVAPVEQLQGFFGTRGLAGRAKHDGQQTAALRLCSGGPFGRGDQVVAGGFGVAGFQAVDARVTKQQQVAVARIGRWRAGVAVFLERVKAHILRKISQQAGGKQGHVARGGDVARRGEPLGVAVTGIAHAQALCRGIHVLHKGFFAAKQPFGQRHGGVIARLHDHALEQVFHAHQLARLNEHARARHFPGLFAHAKGLVHADLAAFERVKHDVGRHQLGQRGRFHHGIHVLGGQDLVVGAHVDEQKAARRQRRRRRKTRLNRRHGHGFGRRGCGAGAGRGNRAGWLRHGRPGKRCGCSQQEASSTSHTGPEGGR